MPDVKHHLSQTAKKARTPRKWHCDWETPVGRSPAGSQNDYFLNTPIFSYFSWSSQVLIHECQPRLYICHIFNLDIWHTLQRHRLHSAFSMTEPFRLLIQSISTHWFSTHILQVQKTQALGFDFTKPWLMLGVNLMWPVSYSANVGQSWWVQSTRASPLPSFLALQTFFSVI